MIVMHSTFNLADGISDEDFSKVFNAYSGHLREQEKLSSWRLMRRQPHDGFNADEPLGNYYLMTEFADMAQAQACWEYVEKDEEPVYSLHRAVRSKVVDTSFYLCTDF